MGIQNFKYEAWGNLEVTCDTPHGAVIHKYYVEKPVIQWLVNQKKEPTIADIEAEIKKHEPDTPDWKETAASCWWDHS